MAQHAKGMGTFRRAVRETGLALITAGVIVLLFATYQLFGTNFTEEHNQASLKKSFQAALAAHSSSSSTTATTAPSSSATTTPSTTTPVAPAAVPGGAIDQLVIPKIGVDKFVVEGVAENDLSKGPGHYPQTVLPGEQGNAAIAGHRTTYGAPFFRLNELAIGDQIDITNTAGQKFVYTVSQPPKVVPPSDIAVLDPTTDAQLTLTTCNPRFSATNRLVVVAVLDTTKSQPAQPVTNTAQLGSPTPVAAANTLGSGNRAAWPPVILYGVVALIGWILVRIAINRTRRWGRFGAYVIGIGVCLIPLWFCFENVVRLLPQNI